MQELASVYKRQFISTILSISKTRTAKQGYHILTEGRHCPAFFVG